jgi:hypothetical protein
MVDGRERERERERERNICEFWIHHKQVLGSLCLTKVRFIGVLCPGTSNALVSDFERKRQFCSGVLPRAHSGYVQ